MPCSPARSPASSGAPSRRSPAAAATSRRTKSVATPIDAEPFLPGRSYAVTGAKHFGSGLGVNDRMMTTAIPEGETDPTIFVLDVRDRPWDGSAGLELVAEWDGMGMAATQSHAMRLVGAPSVRLAWNRASRRGRSRRRVLSSRRCSRR